MNEAQLLAVRSVTLIREPSISISQLQAEDMHTGTVLYGYTVERDTWHVYLQDGLIHRYIYDYHNETIDHQARDSWPMAELIPNKRTYPQYTRYEFAMILARAGLQITFANWQEPMPNRLEWAGRVFV